MADLIQKYLAPGLSKKGLRRFLKMFKGSVLNTHFMGAFEEVEEIVYRHVARLPD